MSWGVATQNGVSVSLASIVSLSCGATEFSPASLFTSGVAGAWYDPSDVLLNWRTNLLTYTEQFDNSVWTKFRSTVSNATSITAPDGTNTAEKLVSNAGLTQGVVYNTSAYVSIVGQTYVGSVYVKAAELGFAFVALNSSASSTAAGICVNLSNGATSNAGASGTFTVTALANGWYRVTASTVSSTANVYLEVSGLAAAGTFGSYTGDGTSGIYLWGAQLELGSTATTYQAITTPEQTYLLYDPQPVLYQDSAGTTPVTAVEQPVGLMLDKSQGLVLGSELVTGAASAYTGNGTVSTVGDTITATCTTNGIYGITWASTFVSNLWVLLTVEVVTNSASKSLLIFPNGNSTALAGGTTTGNKSFITLAPTATGLTRCPIFYINGLVGESFSIRLASIKSYAGNHASQATAASRPVLRARYNLALQSETLSNAAWSNGNILNGTRSNGSVSVTNSEGYAYIQQTGTYVTTVDCTISFDVTCDQTINNVPIRASGVANVYTLVNLVAGQTQRITLTGYRPAAAYFEFGIDARNVVVPGGSDATGYVVTFNRVDLRLSSTSASMPAYQRIAAATDYATAGFLPYLALDGTDDSFATNSINFSATDKMSLCVGVTKLSDAATGFIAELSASTSANNGSFYVAAPESTSQRYSVLGRGSSAPVASQLATTTSNTYLSPVTNVLTGIFNISGDSNNLRLNGTSIDTATGDQGTGNFGNYPLYIGRRNNASIPLNGNLYQLIVCGKALSASELASTEAYVATKTGVTL